MLNLFVWLDDENRYLLLSSSCIFVFAALGVAAAFVGRLDAFLATRRGRTLFLGSMLLALLGSRWPTFFARHRLNPDEAQMAAQAITAFHDPIPWLGFDGGTSGPLNTYVLMLPVLAGTHVTFLSTRVIAVLLEFGAIAALLAAAGIVFGRTIARVCVVPPLVFWAISTQDDFVHYSSEHLSIFLGSLWLALLARAWQRGYPRALVFSSGLIAGMLPFAKLQSVPLDAALSVLTLVTLLFASPSFWRLRFRRVAVFLGGMLTFPALLFATIALAGSLHDFWESYIVTALAYTEGDPMPLSFVTESVEFGPYFDLLAIVAIVGAVICAGRISRVPRRTLAGFCAALTVFAGGVDAIYSPHHASPHYLLFGVVPAAALAAAGLAAIAWFVDERDVPGPKRGTVAAVFVLVSLATLGAIERAPEHWLGYDFSDYVRGGPEDPLAGIVEAHLRPGDRMAIWGWYPEYWVFSDTLLGTRDSVSVFQLTHFFNPARAYFQARYVADFERVRPKAFLDAGSESFDFEGTLRHGYEEFPELAALVDRDYVLVGRWKRFRFYLRKDAAATASRPPPSDGRRSQRGSRARGLSAACAPCRRTS